MLNKFYAKVLQIVAFFRIELGANSHVSFFPDHSSTQTWTNSYLVKDCRASSVTQLFCCPCRYSILTPKIYILQVHSFTVKSFIYSRLAFERVYSFFSHFFRTKLEFYYKIVKVFELRANSLEIFIS